MVWFVILETWGYSLVIKQLFPAPIWLITLLHAKITKQIWKHLLPRCFHHSWQKTEAASTSYTKKYLVGGGGGQNITAVTQVLKVGLLLPWAVGSAVARVVPHPGHNQDKKTYWGARRSRVSGNAVDDTEFRWYRTGRVQDRSPPRRKRFLVLCYISAASGVNTAS